MALNQLCYPRSSEEYAPIFAKFDELIVEWPDIHNELVRGKATLFKICKIYIDNHMKFGVQSLDTSRVLLGLSLRSIDKQQEDEEKTGTKSAFKHKDVKVAFELLPLCLNAESQVPEETLKNALTVSELVAQHLCDLHETDIQHLKRTCALLIKVLK